MQFLIERWALDHDLGTMTSFKFLVMSFLFTSGITCYIHDIYEQHVCLITSSFWLQMYEEQRGTQSISSWGLRGWKLCAASVVSPLRIFLCSRANRASLPLDFRPALSVDSAPGSALQSAFHDALSVSSMFWCQPRKWPFLFSSAPIRIPTPSALSSDLPLLFHLTNDLSLAPQVSSKGFVFSFRSSPDGTF